MNLGEYLRTREGALKENRFSRIALLILVLSNFVLAGALAFKRDAIVLVPPDLDARAEVDFRKADDQMKITWGLYLAGLLGNVTPASSNFLKANIGTHLTSRLYRGVVEAIDKQSKQIREEQITLQFIPTSARYDTKLDKVLVSGEFVVRGVRGSERRGMRTYVMGFKTRNYRVMLDTLDVKEGQWRESELERETAAATEGEGS